MIPMERLRRFLPAVCAGVLLIAAPAASRELLSIRSSVDRDSATVGDPITYLLELSYRADLPRPRVDVNLEGFEIRRTERGSLPPKEGGFISEELRYVIAAYDTGSYTIPPAMASFRSAKGDSGYALSDPVRVRIESVLPPDAKDIRDVKPPLGLRSDLWRMVVPLALALTLGALALPFIVRRRRRRPQAEVAPELPPEPVDYLAELERIASLGLLERGRYKEFYTHISDILRRYIGSRYNIDAMEKTTYEINLGLRDRGVPGDVLRMTGDFLTECDLVKFAKYTPPLELARTAVERAKDIIVASGGSSHGGF